MTRPYDDASTWHGFLRLISRDFRIGSAFGVEVRMYWLAAILVPLLTLRWCWPAASSAIEALFLTAVTFALLFVVIWTHEMGHIAGGWRFAIRSDLITLSPMGGVAHLSAPMPTPRIDLWVTLAGPVVHFAWLLVCWPLLLWLPVDWARIDAWTFNPLRFVLWFLVEVNWTLLLFNLLPFFPMDGGRALRALLAMRWHPNRVTMWVTSLGIAGGVALALWGLMRPGTYGAIWLLIGIVNVQACLRERQLARHAPIYGLGATEVRAPWQQDPEAWKRGAAGDHDRPRLHRPSWLTRWRNRRSARREEQAREQAAALDREVDAILERVHRHGMASLSARERKVLQRASQKKKGAG